MALPVYRLRRLLAAIAILLTLAVAGMYFYARSKATNALKSVPGKIGIDIKQTAQGFQFSKSDGKRTLFTVQASNVKEFKLNGNAELHNVSIVLYGRDASRFDQIYGDDFAYNQKTGEVTAKGEVQIDLLANPAGLESPDQAAPKELRNPIHLKTRDLVFNKDSGNAWTDARVEFRTPQANGSAVGVKYAGKSNTLTLASQIHVELTGTEPMVIEATHGTIMNDPRQIVLEGPRLSKPSGRVRADKAVFYLGPENHVERVLATGDVSTEMHNEKPQSGQSPVEIQGRADHGEFMLRGGQDLLQSATLSGRVSFEELGTDEIQGDAARVIFEFAGKNQLEKVHALDGAHLRQKTLKADGLSQKGQYPQNFELTAPTIDFTVAGGRLLRSAVTSGPAHITISDVPVPNPKAANPQTPQQTVVTAGKFLADFVLSGEKNRLAAIHGSPEVRITNSVPGQPERVSASDSVLAIFLPQGGIDAITQSGNVSYSDNQSPEKRVQAWAGSGRYTPADHILLLTEMPRVVNGAMSMTANSIRINRATGDALAEGDVKSTYSELKEQPNGALLAAASPIHVTANSMATHSPAIAIYSGNARLWQDANVIEAASIRFDRDHRSVTAEGTDAHPAKTILTQIEKGAPNGLTGQSAKTNSSPGRSTPVTITARTLSYVDAERKVHYEGGVLVKGQDLTVSSRTADAILSARGPSPVGRAASGPGRLDRIVAQGDVVIEQPNRQAHGQTLTYTATEDKFVLTGGPPSIFDAEQGKITGVSLTFFRRDDRVLVQGEGSTPVVTTTRVAR